MADANDPTETEMLAFLREGTAALLAAGELDAEEAESMIDWLGEPS